MRYAIFAVLALCACSAAPGEENVGAKAERLTCYPSSAKYFCEPPPATDVYLARDLVNILVEPNWFGNPFQTFHGNLCLYALDARVTAELANPDNTNISQADKDVLLADQAASDYIPDAWCAPW